MKSQIINLLAAFTLLLAIPVTAQQITQNIRGTIVDQDSQMPLAGATVMVVGTSPIIGTMTDGDGNFRLTGVPIGRVTLKVTFMGYEERTIPNLLIGSAKEEILNVTLAESVNTLEAVTITGDQNKGEVLNEMAMISAHTFSVEETSRYAGSFDDPARMVVAFAGVNGDAEGNNDIIVRGNSPKGILWRLEGVAIPNPNHFAGEGSTGGPINALSSKMLSNSDFFTGAFAAEYGDATSGVFDMRLKRGNNEQREYTASISTLGLDMTAEGPFKAGGRGSYIANYRYSALDLLDKAGVVDFGGVPRYQDMSFKIQLPVNGKHSLSIFGLGGMSGIDTEEKDEKDEDIITGKFNGRNKMGVLGLSHTYQINDDMYLKSSLAATGSDNNYKFATPNDDDQFHVIEQGNISKSSMIATTTFNYKLNAKHKLESGIILTRLNFNMKADEWDFDKDVLANELSEEGSSATFQAFASWKYRISENLTMINGLHYLQFALNNNNSIEPRMGLKWQVDDKQSFNVGAGLHSKLEGVSTYLAKRYADDGTFTQPNKDLEITKAAHFVLGYDRRLGENTHLKVETYYQHLYDVPVEDSNTSAYSLLNVSEGYTTRQLVNDGKGKNYGVELTLERYLHNGLYYMSTLSLFRSLYTAKDGIERKSAFDNNYVANLIGGKEFKVGNPSKNKVLFVNTKVALIGGKRYSPINLEASIARGEEVTDELNPFSAKGDDIFRTDFSIGLRRNRKRTTTEFKFDVQNILNNQTVVGEDYINATESIYKSKQLGMLPTISYKVSF
ncbi:carboxypeptidase-like regulatory domain-containing protein [Fulvivirgaceae bacterium PWU4]|uniref:Carboxypeptidase-like regulatory domain-containing protein n=1 Tax=Chryseosolibacter histidini TaxID=2782349 RepID=A0AAP2DHW1_9BACT|nr:TonB-dependent receptor [Chryseosolibacter histidini]MBT1695322.1 carboxypeptidase-like regulatory domain-containing protein [Chryseosolibacter histidini]